MLGWLVGLKKKSNEILHGWSRKCFGTHKRKVFAEEQEINLKGASLVKIKHEFQKTFILIWKHILPIQLLSLVAMEPYIDL